MAAQSVIRECDETMTWWIWLILGVILLTTELLLPSGFFLFFFGVAGLFLATVIFLGLVVTFSVAILLFFAISFGLSWLVRRPLIEHFSWKGDGVTWALPGDEVETLEDIAPGFVGAGKLCHIVSPQGLTWRVRNQSLSKLIQGSKHKIVRVEGITLIVE